MTMTPAPTSQPIIDSRYQVVRLLGQGGMGAVYECRHVGTRRPFAVKVILAEAMGKPQALERFLREAAAAGSIKSPYVVDVSDVGLDRVTGNAFMAMELLSGHDLAKQIELHGKLAPDLVLRVAVQALTGLAAAHAAGVVHRDMKPANLFLAETAGDERVVKVLDFGIAKLDGGGDIQQAKLTRTGVVFGSPSYMSPEQASGAAHIDHRTDIWSFGAVMYEALTGAPPYSDAASLQDLIMRIWAGPPPPLATIAPSVPGAVAEIVARAMTHDAAGRYQSAEEMLSAVKRLVPGAATIPSADLGAGASPKVAEPSEPSEAARGTAALLQGGPPAPRTPVPEAASSKPPSDAAISGGTQLMPPGASAVTHTAFGTTADPPRGRRTWLYAVVTVALTLGLSALALRLIPKPSEPGAPPPSAGEADASASATVTLPAIPSGPSGSKATPEPADAGAPPDPEPDAGSTATPASSAKAPSKPAGTSKPTSVFSPVHRGI